MLEAPFEAGSGESSRSLIELWRFGQRWFGLGRMWRSLPTVSFSPCRRMFRLQSVLMMLSPRRIRIRTLLRCDPVDKVFSELDRIVASL